MRLSKTHADAACFSLAGKHKLMTRPCPVRLVKWLCFRRGEPDVKSIFTHYECWHVSNMMFWRVILRACEVGRDLAKTAEELAWVDKLCQFEQRTDTYSPDLTVDELFASTEEIGFWIALLEEYANAFTRGASATRRTKRTRRGRSGPLVICRVCSLKNTSGGSMLPR